MRMFALIRDGGVVSWEFWSGLVSFEWPLVLLFCSLPLVPAVYACWSCILFLACMRLLVFLLALVILVAVVVPGIMLSCRSFDWSRVGCFFWSDVCVSWWSFMVVLVSCPVGRYVYLLSLGCVRLVLSGCFFVWCLLSLVWFYGFLCFFFSYLFSVFLDFTFYPIRFCAVGLCRF